jgi:hypothetical protein
MAYSTETLPNSQAFLLVKVKINHPIIIKINRFAFSPPMLLLELSWKV